MRRINGGLTLFWVAMCVPSIALGWVDSVKYVSFLSLWALIASHWAAWQSARVEVRQDEDADVAEVLAELRQLTSDLGRTATRER
jgi:hypothetical protein